MSSKNVSSPGSSRGIKREYPAEGPDDSSSPSTTTASPKSDNQGTPVKRRLEFDYFAKKAESTLPELKIKTITLGQCINNGLKFRVSLKSDMKKVSIGNILNFHGIDETGEISFVAFPEQAEKANEILQVNEIYELINFNVKEDSITYPSGSGHSLQIHLNRNSILTLQSKDNKFASIPMNFIKLSDVQNRLPKEKIDTIGVFVHDYELETTKDGKIKRDISLVDDSKVTTVLTLWDKKAEDFLIKMFDVVAIRRGVISAFGGKNSISWNSGTLLWVNPENNETQRLKEWILKEEEKRNQDAPNTD